MNYKSCGAEMDVEAQSKEERGHVIHFLIKRKPIIIGACAVVVIVLVFATGLMGTEPTKLSSPEASIPDTSMISENANIDNDLVDDTDLDEIESSIQHENNSPSNSGAPFDIDMVAEMFDLDDISKEFLRSHPPESFIYDESDWPQEKNFVPAFPEYADSINWYEAVKGLLFGYGASIQQKSDVKDYVNIKERPLISAGVVGELHSGDMASMFTEKYQSEYLLHIGDYRVWSDGYIWYYIEFNYALGKRGWIVSDFVEVHGI